ncbi:MAG: carboxypeptidase regulatory-like domain-containing protein [Bryobacteraceae bacterium]
MNSCEKLVTLACLTLTLGATAGTAQVVNATVTGTAKDPSGAVIAGAKVRAVNTDTNFDYKTETDSSGLYAFRSLPPGSYRLEAEASGFQKYVASGVTLQVNQQARIDLALQVGEMTQTVDVAATTPLIDTEAPVVGGVIPDRNIVSLPLNGRNFMELTTLTSGMNEGGTSNAKGGILNKGFAPSGAGQPAAENNYQLDGADNNESFFETYNVAPPVDAVREFKSQVGQYSAEFGAGGGAVISVVTKSGTNDIHGTVWHFLRNDITDSRNFFLTPTQNKAPIRRNQYGFVLGGPVLIPRLYNGKDKTFFFASYEGNRLSRSFFRSGVAPTAEMLQGNFTDYARLRPVTLLDPFTKAPYPNNVIPSSQLSPISLALARYWDAPNNPANPRQSWVANLAGRDNADSFQVRGDHRINQGNEIFGRYNSTEVDRFTPGTFPRAGGVVQPQRFQNAALGLTSNLRPNLLNEFRFAFNRATNRSRGQNNGTPVAADAGVPFAYRDPLRAGFISGMGLGNSLVTGISEGGLPWFLTVNQFQFWDGITWVRGRHNLKAGADVSRIRSDAFLGTHGNGNYTFDGRHTGDGFADFLLGYPSSAILQLVPNETGRFRRTSYAFYFLDDWKVNSRLTLNIGVRYEYRTPPLEKGGLSSIFDPTLANGVGGLAFPNNNTTAVDFYRTFRPDLGVRLLDRNTMTLPDKNNFAPRFGFAFRPLGNTKLVVRGGYGWYYSSPAFNNIVQNSLTAPPAQQWPTYASATDRPTVNWGGNIGTPISEALKTATFGVITGPEQKFLDAYTQQYSLSISKEIGNDFVVEVGYLGSKGTHLETAFDYNWTTPAPGAFQPRLPFPKWGRLVGFSSGGGSWYNSLLVTAEKRFSKGLSFKGSYTHGRVYLTNAARAIAVQNPANLKLEKGPTGDDMRHRFTNYFTYELPLGKGRRFLADANKLTNAVLGGWNVSGITTMRTGLHLNPTIGAGNCNSSLFNSCRADAIGPTIQNGESGVDKPRFLRDAYEFPLKPGRPAQPPRFGTSGYNTLRGNGINNWDMSLQKNFSLTERFRLEFRWETFNTWNHGQFASPTGSPDNPNFGRTFSTQVNPRENQFALKLYF